MLTKECDEMMFDRGVKKKYRQGRCFECGKLLEHDEILAANDNMRGIHAMCIDCFEPGKVWFNEPPYTRHWNYRHRKEGDIT